MLGAMAGDIIGSRFEFANIKTKEFPLFTNGCRFTDDSVLTAAVARALMEFREGKGALPDLAVSELRNFARSHPDAGYGGMFASWVDSQVPTPYGSYGNGAAMRISPVGWIASSKDEVREFSRQITSVTHNHPDAIRGAEAVSMAVYLLRTGAARDQVRLVIASEYGYDLNKSLDEIRPHYCFDVSCSGSIPPALTAFFEADDFEDAIRNAVSLGGDSDTIAAITGSLAEAHFGIPIGIREATSGFLDDELWLTILDFARYAPIVV